jgi:hypothetical protein
MNTKFCIKCKIEKSTSEFTKASNSKDGLQVYCKECRKLANKEYFSKHPDYIKNYRANL